MNVESGTVRRWLGVASLIVVVLLPFLVYPVFLSKILCYALFAVGFHVLLGYGGMLSFGHAAFFGMGAYLTGHLVNTTTLPTEIVLLGSVALGAVMGLLFGALAIRRQGIYQAMITLALAQVVYLFALRAPFTGGENGIQGIQARPLLGWISLENQLVSYYFCLAILLLALLFVHRLNRSQFGLAMAAIKNNPVRSETLGYKVWQYKLTVFGISGAMASLAGALKALVLQLTTLADVHWAASGDVLFMTLLGGMGTLFGPVLGAAVLISLHNFLASIGSWLLIVQGVFFIACVLLFRNGIVGTVNKFIK